MNIKRVIQSKKFHLSGWLVAAALMVAFVATGSNELKGKTGKIDFEKVFAESKLGRQNSIRIKQASNDREELLKFLDVYRIATKEQAQKLQSVILKEKKVEQDKLEIKKIKDEIIEEDNKRAQLSQKQSLSDDEKKQLTAYSARSAKMSQHLQKLSSQFNEEIYKIQQESFKKAFKTAKESLKKAAEKKGFSKVFDSKVLHYCSNDLTEITINEMNATTK